MATMSAYRLLDWQRPPEIQEVPVPEVGPDEVLVKVAGVGLCHSDITFMDVPAGILRYDLPFTLGHETAGWVHATGAGVTDLAPGTPVIAVAHNWCGRCEYCLRGQDHLCLAHPNGGAGYGLDGGLAEFITIPRNSLVELGDLDPREVGPLSDAAATAYHAVHSLLPVLRPGMDVVVIGAGGLGGYGIQLLKVLTGVRVIASDTDQRRRENARALGADVVVESDDQLGERLREATGGRGAMVVLDFVGTDATIATALATVRPAGRVVIVGAGGGTARVGWGASPSDCHVYVSFASTAADVHEVIALAQAGRLSIPVETFPFAQVELAYDKLRRGDLLGRAVVVMSDQP
jgi:alcohol dehydrogenase, propanol-preferring